MAKGGSSRSSGSFSSTRSSSISSSSYRVAPAPIPKVHNNIFSAPKKIETVTKSSVPPPPAVAPKPTLSTPVSSATPSSGGFLSTMAEGFSFGVGSSVARNVVDRIFSPSVPVTIPKTTSNNSYCTDLEKSWNECMSMNNQDLNICRKAYEDYEACKRNV